MFHPFFAILHAIRQFSEMNAGTTMLGAKIIGNSKMNTEPGSFIQYGIIVKRGNTKTAAPTKFHAIRNPSEIALCNMSKPRPRADNPNRKSGIPTHNGKDDEISPPRTFMTDPIAPIRKAWNKTSQCLGVSDATR